MTDSEEDSFENELHNHLKLASENGVNTDTEYKKIMNMTYIIDVLHRKGLTIEELKDPLIVQECIKSNFSSDAKIINAIFDMIRG
jgi:hypothetical protein